MYMAAYIRTPISFTFFQFIFNKGEYKVVRTRCKHPPYEYRVLIIGSRGLRIAANPARDLTPPVYQWGLQTSKRRQEWRIMTDQLASIDEFSNSAFPPTS